jgi:hypothetical protein
MLLATSVFPYKFIENDFTPQLAAASITLPTPGPEILPRSTGSLKERSTLKTCGKALVDE